MVTAVKTEPGRLSDWLLFEEDSIGRYSRDNVVVAPNQTLKCGAVVGYNEAGTQVVEYDDAAPAVAAGILVADVTTGATPIAGAIVARHARINPNALVWKAALGAPAKANALADFAAAGIVLVTEA